jgi:hypothetical protein
LQHLCSKGDVGKTLWAQFIEVIIDHSVVLLRKFLFYYFHTSFKGSACRHGGVVVSVAVMSAYPEPAVQLSLTSDSPLLFNRVFFSVHTRAAVVRLLRRALCVRSQWSLYHR